MAERRLLDRAGLCARLNISVECFYRQRRALEADGLPRPVMGRMALERWDPAALDCWLDSKLPGPTDPAASIPRDDLAAKLDARAARLAGEA